MGATPTEIRSAYEGWEGVDVVAHSNGPRRKMLLVADMDSTMIGQECIDELADYAGVKAEVSAITERAMKGELDFAGALGERVALLKGLDEAIITQCLAERVRPNPGAGTLVRTMRAWGAKTLLVSGGFTAFARPVAEILGFEHVEANVLGIEAGRLTGEVTGRIVDAGFKRSSLIAAREKSGIGPVDVIAIGDGANDALMIEEAGLGIAYRAKPILSDIADARLDHHPLDALLWAQGIPRSEWIEV
ncbi:phosphoserine phosphatase SerB [Sphingomonas sp. LY160]|uniref:phosphoserine phosphatase SerB n=1 Tax=Sphingomonas sp. LY160 TaxID=3095342 RepID=UPI002ADEACCA|nr:phosphoserine phosphatase SerB [Sphingomonas sp. LY160]MEA1071055.1 phosphoserine phosphatase SerB [Sphingomonas sp. LY160]